MSMEVVDQGRKIPIVAKNSIAEPEFAAVQEKAQKMLSSTREQKTEMDSVFFREDKFELLCDTRNYKLEELQCILYPKCIEITGAKKNMMSARAYELPQAIETNNAKCFLTKDGILLLSVPWTKAN